MLSVPKYDKTRSLRCHIVERRANDKIENASMHSCYTTNAPRSDDTGAPDARARREEVALDYTFATISNSDLCGVACRRTEKFLKNESLKQMLKCPRVALEHALSDISICEAEIEYEKLKKTKTTVHFGDRSLWWRHPDSLHAATNFDRNEDDVIVAHDIFDSGGQAKMYGILDWRLLLLFCVVPFSWRASTDAFVNKVSPKSSNVRLAVKDTPRVAYHTIRGEGEPIHALLLDFDFDDESIASDALGAKGAVAHTVSLLTSKWSTWFPQRTAHVLLFSTASDDNFEEELPSVHGYLFERWNSTRDDERLWPFCGPSFADKRAVLRLFSEYIHPAMEADTYYGNAGIDPQKFLDAVPGHTARAIGMTKCERRDQTLRNSRYMRTECPLCISSPLALEAFKENTPFATGRMLSVFTDVPVCTYWCDADDRDERLRFYSTEEELFARIFRQQTNEVESVPNTRKSVVRRGLAVRDERLVEVLIRCWRSLLTAIDASKDILRRLRLDARRTYIYRDKFDDTPVVIMAYQTSDCTFCPVRECDVTWTRRDGAQYPRALRTSKDAKIHSDGDAKMYVVFRIRERGVGSGVVTHHCWKCHGRRVGLEKGFVCGTLTPSMRRILRAEAMRSNV